MDNLKFACSWKGGVTGARFSCKLSGLQLEGCVFDGMRLSESQRDSPIVTTIPDCTVAWIPKVLLVSACLVTLRMENKVTVYYIIHYEMPTVSTPERICLKTSIRVFFNVDVGL